MFAYILFFVILPMIFLVWGIINILASKYNWTVILIMSQWTISPFDLAFGKKFIEDERIARNGCMIYGIVLSVIGICVLLAGIIIIL